MDMMQTQNQICRLMDSMIINCVFVMTIVVKLKHSLKLKAANATGMASGPWLSHATSYVQMLW